MSELNEQLLRDDDIEDAATDYYKPCTDLVEDVFGFARSIECRTIVAMAERNATPAPQAAPSDTITIDGRTYTAAEIKQRITDLDAEATAYGEQRDIAGKVAEELEDRLAVLAAPSEPMLYARQFDLDTQGAWKPVLAYATPEGDFRVPLYAAPLAAQQSPADARDAERYRWLVDQFGTTSLPGFLERRSGIFLSCGIRKDGIDKFIDTAIAAATTSTEGR